MSRVSVTIDANSAGFEQGMKRVEKSLEGAKDMVLGFFALDKGVEIVKEISRNAIEMGSSLVNGALKLDTTIEQLQVLRAAAKESGTEMSELESALLNVADAKQKALAGDKASLAGFKALGVNGVEDLKSGNAVDLLFGKIASTVKSKNVEDIVSPLKEIIGKPFKDILPLLNSDVDEVGRHLKAIGGIMDTDTAVKLKTLGGEFETIGTVLTVGFGPAIISVIEALEKLVSKVLHYIYDTDDQKKEKRKDSEDDFKTREKAFWQILWGEVEVVATANHSERGTENIGEAMVKLSDKGLMDIRAHGAGTPADRWDNMLIELQAKMEELANRLKNHKAINNDKSTVDNMPKAHRIYSDSLTSRGNMIGASFGNVANVSNQLAVAKQHVIISQAQLAEQKQQTMILTQMKSLKGGGFDLVSLF